MKFDLLVLRLNHPTTPVCNKKGNKQRWKFPTPHGPKEALQAGAEVPGRLGPVMWNWEDSATWGRLPPGWLYLKLALHAADCTFVTFGCFCSVNQLSVSRMSLFNPKFRKN